ncbi:MAG: MarR family transcriptional regulator [Clostridia bacterium]|nr:MarR family transcriptional regulator [Clostridia bacterium]
MIAIMRYINLLSRAQSIYRADKLQEPQLSPVHHSYVLAICNHPGLSQEELSRHLCINKSNVARQLAGLEANGYIARTPDERDKRQFRIYPTERMLALLPAVRAITEDWNDYLTDGIPEEELAVFHATLEKIAARARQYVGEREACIE